MIKHFFLFICMILSCNFYLYGDTMGHSDGVQHTKNDTKSRGIGLKNSLGIAFFTVIFIVHKIRAINQERSLVTNYKYQGFFKIKDGYKCPDSERILAIRRINPDLVAEYEIREEALIRCWVYEWIGKMGLLYALIHGIDRKLKSTPKVNPVVQA